MEFSSADLNPKQLYKLMTGSVVPRPIGWISTRSATGIANLAPFSYFMAVSAEPPTLLFSTGRRASSAAKDTYHNVLASRDFVVNIVTAELAEAMNISAADAPAEVSEFDLAGLTAASSCVVSAPRVKESPINFECRLSHTYEVGTNVVVFGEVVHIHIADEILLAGEKIDFAKLDVVGRLAGSSYTLHS
jgi:flavin reductase (DIM6/NTAB) family NADH-FMN oxidoreductase RutF